MCTKHDDPTRISSRTLKKSCRFIQFKENQTISMQFSYPQAKICNFYQTDARSKHPNLQKFYRIKYTTSHDLPVLKITVKQPSIM